MPPPVVPYQPYAHVHKEPTGPGDARPSALQIVGDCNAVGKLKDKTILITGCSAGIGLETARALYETGAKLFLTARDMPKLEKAIADIVKNAGYNKTGRRPKAIEMHLDSFESVRKGAAAFAEESDGGLNILINNAGVMAAPYSKTKDAFEMHIGTNHFGHFLLYKLLEPTLLESAKDTGTTSRVINVSSFGHRYSSVRFDDMHWEKDPDSYDKWQAYGQSKTANIWMANSITRHYGFQNMHGLSVHPGTIVDTGLVRNFQSEDWERLESALEVMSKHVKSPEQGAATTVWAALSPHFEDQNGGRYLADCGEAPPISTNAGKYGMGFADHAYDVEGEEKLWNLSCAAVGVHQGG